MTIMLYALLFYMLFPDPGLIHYAILDRNVQLVTALLSPPWSLNVKIPALVPHPLLGLIGKLGRSAGGCLLTPLQVCALRKGRYELKETPSDNFERSCAALPLDAVLGSDEKNGGVEQGRRKGGDPSSVRGIQNLHDDGLQSREAFEMEGEIVDSTRAFHDSLEEDSQVKLIMDLIHSARLEEINSSERERRGCNGVQNEGQSSSSLTCCELILSALERENRATTGRSEQLDSSSMVHSREDKRLQGTDTEEEKEGDDRNQSLLDQMHFAFHIALSLRKDTTAAHILSRIFLLSSSENGLAMCGVDASAILDKVVDGKGLGVKSRSDFITYCCLTGSPLVLHHLLSTYTIEWSVQADIPGVQEYMHTLLFEIAVRGMTSAVLILVYHMDREGLIDTQDYIEELSALEIPKNTYAALKDLGDALLTPVDS